jgi:two-component system, OmpR family, sensor histidine kinase MprB
MIARSLEETDQALRRIGVLLALIALAGIGGAAVMGFTVARRALRPVERLSRVASEITATGDLHRRLPAGTDELGQLGARFNEMLEALHSSLDAQRALVADASHELRTPLTSLRTNIEVLARARSLPAAERDAMLADITAQIEGLSRLVNDLIDLARGSEPDEHREDVRLDELVGRAVEEARRNHPGTAFELRAEPVVVEAAPARVERAVANLIDNAAKYGGAAGRPVEIAVDARGVVVRDHGPGFGEADLPRIFDRFFRGATVRAVPGSGLGLAIAKQVADRHGWELHAENADPGARLSLRIPARADDGTTWFSPD